MTCRDAVRGRSRRAGRAEAQKPYSPAEVDALLLWARNQASALRADALLALLVLGLGAGLDTADIAAVRGTDIRQDPASPAVLVAVRRDGTSREVPLLVRCPGNDDMLGADQRGRALHLREQHR